LDCRVLCASRPVSCWVTHNPHRCLFPYPMRFSLPAVPRFLRIGFILSCPSSSSKFLRLSFRLALSEQPILLGFLPSSRHHRERLLTTRAHLLSLRSVLRLLQPLDGLLRLRLRGLVASHCHVQGSFRSGVSPDSQLSWLIARRCPLAVTKPTTHRPR